MPDQIPQIEDPAALKQKLRDKAQRAVRSLPRNLPEKLA